MRMYTRALLGCGQIALLMVTLLMPAIAEAAAIRMAVMGDSISAGSSGSNWIGQLNSTFPGDIAFQNKAVGGATSSSVVSGQLASVVTLAAGSKIDNSVLIIGGNDAHSNNALLVLTGASPSAFINTYVNNVKQVIDSIAAAGPGVRQVFGNMPDITVTPKVQQQAALLGATPAQVQLLSAAIGQANAQANAYALSHNVPVVDMYTASHTVLTESSFSLGGHTYTTPFAADNFHPATWVQGLLANMVDTAFNLHWGQELPLLSDQQIVANTGFTPSGSPTYYNVTPYILLPVPEPSTFALAGIGGTALLIYLRRQLVARAIG